MKEQSYAPYAPLKSIYHGHLSREHFCSYQKRTYSIAKRPRAKQAVGGMDYVLRNKNEPHNISSMGFPLQLRGRAQDRLA
jgi:hypothetical protein